MIPNQAVEGATPQLHPLVFLDKGSNTPVEVTREQIIKNVKRDLPWLEVKPAHTRPLIIVAGGPSLKYRWPEILTYDADILALNGTYEFLLSKGITPKYWMLLDARRENIDFVNSAHPDVTHYLAAQCHPDIFDALSDKKVCLYLTTHQDTMEAVEGIDKPKVRIGGPAGTVGIKSMGLGFALGYREFHLFGYDSSYEDTHHAYDQKLNDHSKTIDVHLDGKVYVTTPAFAQQATEFCGMITSHFLPYGCNVELHCNGLLPAVVAHNNKVGEVPLEQREREKYETVWAHDKYRKHAPGEGMVPDAIDLLGMKPGDSVIDFGCGCGRASQAFNDKGFKLTAVDFAANCLDPDVSVNFIQACLWDLPDIKADFGYCTDVMEHIPTEKVGDVLSGIADRCQAAFFNIATRPDVMGNLIGRKLHMTVMQGDGWYRLLQHYWENVAMQEREGEATFVVSGPKRRKND